MATRRNALELKALLRSEATEEALRACLAEIGGVELQVLRGSLGDNHENLDADSNRQIILVDLDTNNAEEIGLLQQAMENGLARNPVVATSDQASVEGLRRLMRLQILDYLPQPLAEQDVAAVIEAARRRIDQAGPSSVQAMVLSFIKPCGGLGATTLAIEAAFALLDLHKKESAPRVCLVDLDLQFGNIATYLDIEGQLHLSEIKRSPHRLDSTLIRNAVVTHERGIDVLAAAEGEFVEYDASTSEAVTRLLEVLNLNYDYIVIDLPSVWTDWTINVLGGSDTVFLTTQLTVGAIRQASKLLRALELQGLGEVPLAVVFNRFERGLMSRGPSVRETEKALGRKVDFFIPNDWKVVSEALNRGVPISEVKRRNKIGREVRAMIMARLKASARQSARATAAAS